MRRDGQDPEGRVHPVSRGRTGVVLQLDQVLEDAAGRLRERQERLHAVLAVAIVVDDGGDRIEAARRPGGVAARVSSALWRRPWTRAATLLTPPLAWFVLIYLA